MPSTETVWVVPDKANLSALISQIVLNAATTISGDNQTKALSLSVANIRSSVLVGARVPLSQTASSVPPEAEQHAYVLAINLLTSGTPNLGTVVVTLNGGVVSPWLDLVKEAKAWCKEVREGAAVPMPSLPMVRGKGANLVPDQSAYNAAGQIVVTGLSIGTQYAFTPGPNETNIVCGSTTLAVLGSFYASAATATITGAGAGYIFSGLLQLVELAANFSRGGTIGGMVDLSTPGPSGWGTANTYQIIPAQQAVTVGVGNVLYNGVVAPNGVQIGSVGDKYSQIVSGVLVQVWTKTTGNGDNTGWT